MLCHCDNEGVVAAVRGGCCKDPTLAHMLRCLFFLWAKYVVLLMARHIPGVENWAADSLSRNNLPLFFTLLPQAQRHPEVVPEGTGTSPDHRRTMDLQRLEGLARDLVNDSLAPSTKWVYSTGQKRYLNFCSVHDLNPFPLSEDQLCTFMVDEGLQHSSIIGYLSAIRRMQIVRGWGTCSQHRGPCWSTHFME